MSEFLARSACRGRRPAHGAASRHVPRPALIARLLRERHVARFVVAPDGFGKTNLALEYADTVFSFEHVFWVEGKSPCFLRDLDAGAIAETLPRLDARLALVVIEDMPPLDPDRARRLSADLDALLEGGCEVLVTCTPACDVLEGHRDRVCLLARDLLLNDEELDATRLAGERLSDPAPQVPPARRVPGLAWGDEGSRAGFLAAMAREELPGSTALVQFTALALGAGALEDIGAVVPLGAAQASHLAKHYPHLGIDVGRGAFEAAEFSAEELASAFSARIDAAVAVAWRGDRDDLARDVADALAARGRLERACDLARLLMGRPARAEWLARRGAELLEGACLLPASKAFLSLSGQLGDEAFRLQADEAARRALLGDAASARTSARRVARADAAPLRDRAVAALVLGECGGEAEQVRAVDLMGSLVAAGVAAYGDGGPREQQDWICALQVRLALGGSRAEAAEAWLAWHDRGLRGRLSLVAASWVLQACARRDAERSQGADPVFRLAQAVREAASADGPLPLSRALAGMAYEQACGRGALGLRPLDAAASYAVRRAESALYAQRGECERAEREAQERRRMYGLTHPDALRDPSRWPASPAKTALEPVLTVNLFGGMRVFMGGEEVDPRRFRRVKEKTLLALLTLNRGHEASRERLSALLWPESDPESARHNFYGIWSSLRRVLTTPGGSCPYLIRESQGVRLDAALLETDVDQMEDVCRTLLLEGPGFGGWAQVYDQVEHAFSEDLMPGEAENAAIASMRVDYRNRLVDALVAAASRLVAAGDVQEGLWFARAALKRDRTREDAYAMLMRAQVAAGQRASALDTYFACRRFLTEELGIDPAVETVEIYRSIIEVEEAL